MRVEIAGIEVVQCAKGTAQLERVVREDGVLAGYVLRFCGLQGKEWTRIFGTRGGAVAYARRLVLA